MMQTSSAAPAPEVALVQAAFADLEREQSASEALHALRKQGLESFVQQGLPTSRWESWRHTSLKSLQHEVLVQAPSSQPAPKLGELREVSLPLPNACTLMVIDGRYRPELSSSDLPRGVSVVSLNDVLAQSPDLAAQLGREPNYHQESLAALNTALLRDGLVLRVERGAVVERPLHVMFVAAQGAEHTLAPRLLLLAGENSELTLVESYRALPTAAGVGYVTNAVTELTLASAARVQHLRVQHEGEQAYHFGALHVRQERDSTLRSWQVALGARLCRVALTAHLEGAGATCDVSGLGVVTGEQHLDNYSVIHHRAPHCQSREQFKNVLDGRSSTAFNAKMVVHPGAVQSAGEQQNRNLLLSQHAVANTRPQLEIYNNDVKAAHGATVGQLDPDQLFYLRARGIGEQEARRELTLGFAREVLETLPLPELQESLSAAVRARLG